MSKKVGVYAAHDDDSILAAGGRIVQHLNNGDDVFIVTCADGRNSHKAVLGIENNPSVLQVKKARLKEIKRALKVLGVSMENLYFLQLTDGEGKIWQNKESVRNQLSAITKNERPDVIYFHSPDAHPDHRAVSQVVMETLPGLPSELEAYQFFIWTKELAQNRPEVDANNVPEIPRDVLRVNIKEELSLKRASLFEMKSQVNVWPYPNWQVQVSPILDSKFIDYFLRGEEIFVRVKSCRHSSFIITNRMLI